MHTHKKRHSSPSPDMLLVCLIYYAKYFWENWTFSVQELFSWVYEIYLTMESDLYWVLTVKKTSIKIWAIPTPHKWKVWSWPQPEMFQWGTSPLKNERNDPHTLKENFDIKFDLRDLITFIPAHCPWRVLSENGCRFSLVATRLDLLIGQSREQT